MQELLETAEKEGWQKVLYEKIHLKDARDYNIIGDERRADWKYLLPLKRSAVVLDLGCGWGAISISLSEVADTVYSMDATLERVRWLDLRRRQEGITNIIPVHGGDQLKLPFPEKYFDLICMVGVLEWVGSWDEKINPKQAQIEMLNEVFKLLKKGGILYIGIENRFGINYLLGGKDHNGLPFVSILPRFLASIISKRFTGNPYTTYQYSVFGYRELLNKAGFRDIVFYAPLPQYRSPIFYLPLDNSRVINYFFRYLFGMLSNTSASTRKYYGLLYDFGKIISKVMSAVNLSYLAKLFAPGFSVIAKKGD